MINQLETDYEKADYFQNILIARATGGKASESEYSQLRTYFINSPYSHLIPNWLRSKRSLDQFWPFIQSQFETYRDRRTFIYDELSVLLDETEKNTSHPMEKSVDMIIESPSYESVKKYWDKCTERAMNDPEGAITSARTLIETVLKHLVEDFDIEVQKKNPDLPELYSVVAKRLKLSPKSHNEKLIKSILSGCNTIVSGIGELRNLYGDAHGRKRSSARIEPRHGLLAVNLAGSMASFLIATANKQLNSKQI